MKKKIKLTMQKLTKAQIIFCSNPPVLKQIKWERSIQERTK